ncbi:MAG: diguanylate cyclase [Fulvimarina manganoxydans]|uniref:GGDEF domain-containing protein n=1 Tax=Fulvimarina manganoxydans TaxID=937218 RepID=UPI002357FD36|nr:diguanylate cyclase [Fulvimarina manganoxydans]MCK5931445.1 diguanylate cyclase [Fulvimarina manganoxydans]
MLDPSVFMVLIDGMGLMALLALAYGSIGRVLDRGRGYAEAIGLVFGLGAVAATLGGATSPLEGSYCSLPYVIVALAGGFAGWRSATLAGFMASIAFYFVGDIEAASAVLAIAGSAVIGLAWRRFTRPQAGGSAFDFVSLALMLAANIMFFGALGSSVSVSGAPVLSSTLLTCLVAVLSLGWMMRREDRLRRREGELRIDALTDPLTGLGNRRAFEALLKVELAAIARQGVPLSMLLLDVDHFKRINDTHGHETGDRVLKRLAFVLRQNVRDADYVFRLGGEEFCVLLPGASRAAAVKVAERIRRVTGSANLGSADRLLSVTFSIGVSTARTSAIPHIRLYASADSALYQAKTDGRDRVCQADDPSGDLEDYELREDLPLASARRFAT